MQQEKMQIKIMGVSHVWALFPNASHFFSTKLT